MFARTGFSLMNNVGRQLGTSFHRRLTMTGMERGGGFSLANLPPPSIISKPINLLPTHLPRQLPSSQINPMPTTLPSTASTISILDKYSLNDDSLFYDCPSLINETIRCAWTSTNYRYRRQRRVRNHPSRLSNTVRYRARRMRLHHKKKWLKKFKYDLLKKLREKIKRRGKLFEMENAIILGKADQFNAENYVKRELEKAKFYGYHVAPIYDEIRNDIGRLKIE